MALSDKEIIDALNKDTGQPPSWSNVYNKWFATEYLPWINSVQGTNVKLADLGVSKDGTIIPNAQIPLWNWNTGSDYANQKAALDQRYIDSVNQYNQKNGTSIEPDKSVLGAGVQPNQTYRAADEGGFLSDITGGISSAIGGAVDTVGDWVQKAADHPVESAALLAAAYYGGPAAYEALTSGAAATPAEAIASASPEFTGALPAGSAYVAPEVGAGTQLAALAPDAAVATDAGAGTALSGIGENAYTAAQDAQDALAMTGNPAANASLTGVGAIGAQNAYPALNAAAAGDVAAAGGTGAAIAKAAGAGAAGGTALADILPYTTGAGVVGSLLQADAAKSAADAQSAAAQAGIAQQQANFNTINAQQAPYRAAGYNALNNIANLTTGQTPQYDANGNIVKDANGNPVMTTGSGYLQHQFDATDLQKGLAPNYDFMLGQGQMANQRAANAGGGALGGNALQGLNKYTQDYAGNAYQNAFTNYQNQRSNIYNTLAGIAGIGQTGQNATNAAATNATNAATQLGVGSAGAQAAGTVGSANAYTNAINNTTNQYTLASLLNQRGNVQMPLQG